MRIYRRHMHCKKADGLTVDNVLCKVLPRGHLTANGKYLCFHDMQFRFPEEWSPGQIEIGWNTDAS